MTKIRRVLAVLASCLPALGCLPADARSQTLSAAATTPIVIGVEDDWAPFAWEGEDGQPRGYSVDVVSRVFLEMGVPVELASMSFSRCLRDAREGRVAACFNTMYDDDAIKAYLMPQTPLFREPLIVMTRSSRVGAAIDRQGLHGRAVGYVQSYQYPEWFLRSPDIRRVPARSEKHLLMMLDRGRVDFVLLGGNVAAWKLQTEPELKNLQVRMVGQVSNDGFGVAFSRRHPKGEALRKDFERTLSEMQARDAFEDARRKYLLRMER